MKEICNECGDSVKFGSGKFVNRIVDLNDLETRKEMNKPYPEGDYICEECDSQIRDQQLGAASEGREFLKLITEVEPDEIDDEEKYSDGDIEIWLEELGYQWNGSSWIKEQ